MQAIEHRGTPPGFDGRPQVEFWLQIIWLTHAKLTKGACLTACRAAHRRSMHPTTRRSASRRQFQLGRPGGGAQGPDQQPEEPGNQDISPAPRYRFVAARAARSLARSTLTLLRPCSRPGCQSAAVVA